MLAKRQLTSRPLSCCRLSFNEELAKPLTVLRNPYHLAAIKGNIALAAFLHERGVSCYLPLRPPSCVVPDRKAYTARTNIPAH